MCWKIPVAVDVGTGEETLDLGCSGKWWGNHT